MKSLSTHITEAFTLDTAKFAKLRVLDKLDYLFLEYSKNKNDKASVNDIKSIISQLIIDDNITWEEFDNTLFKYKNKIDLQWSDFSEVLKISRTKHAHIYNTKIGRYETSLGVPTDDKGYTYSLSGKTVQYPTLAMLFKANNIKYDISRIPDFINN